MFFSKPIYFFKKLKINILYISSAHILIYLILITALFIDIVIKKNLLFIPLIISTTLTILLLKWGIPKLKKLNLGQVIREEGPKDHFKKSGTPSMGGLLVVPVGLLIGNLTTMNLKVLIISILTIGYKAIGLIDDWKSINLKMNQGLTPKQKLFLQALIGSLFIIFSYQKGYLNSYISLWNENQIELGILILPIALFILIAESNSTNLTDGLDGLASGCSAIIFTGLSILLCLKGNTEGYELGQFCIALAGSWIGFLIFNKNPAKIFMGDTGSLSIGATLAGVALLSNSLWSLFLMGGVFLAEALSVILQVGVFKTTKKVQGTGYRLFRMAPIHHHLELKGYSEIKIVQSPNKSSCI